MKKTQIGELFGSVFGKEPDICEFAPGRVNLIGEHTDYNGGYVFPCATGLGITCAAAKRSDNIFRFYSKQFESCGITELTGDDLVLSGKWSDYPVSVIKTFANMGYSCQYGADFLFDGDLPDGSGLSSSAAMEVVTGKVLCELNGFSLTGQMLAVIGQFAENRFIGVNCGIMDQFASAMAKENNAVLLDTDTLSFEYVPVPFDKASIVIVNSGVRHSLASSAYNERRQQCQCALSDLKKVTDIKNLCSLSAEDFDSICVSISDEVCRRRAKHAVYENARTKLAASALQKGYLETFGSLMTQSHISLRDDYEVSCGELDYLVSTALGFNGVYGARMTGGGFGGCTVNLVKKEKAEAFENYIKEGYKSSYGISPAVFSL